MSPPSPEFPLRAIAGAGARSMVNAEVRLLVLAAHPDDETIGASTLLGRVRGAVVIFLTDGAPRDRQFRPPHVKGSRQLYACIRAGEAASALAHVEIPQERILFLSGVDQEAIFQVGALVDELVPILQEFQPTILATHAYEGGHPDHDAAALIARLGVQVATRQIGNVINVVEMTAYHAVDGQRVTGEFLDAPPLFASSVEPTIQFKMSSQERTRKARMLGCYISQWHVLSDFPLEPERFRVAPLYDFTQPPHEGQLWYERLGWPLSGEHWRELAGQALAECGQLACH